MLTFFVLFFSSLFRFYENFHSYFLEEMLLCELIRFQLCQIWFVYCHVCYRIWAMAEKPFTQQSLADHLWNHLLTQNMNGETGTFADIFIVMMERSQALLPFRWKLIPKFTGAILSTTYSIPQFWQVRR